MIDGITLKYMIENFEAWKLAVQIPFTNSVYTDTGEIPYKKRNEKIITTHRGRWETFEIIVKQVVNTNTHAEVFHLTMRGSLHKNHYGGSNYLPFTWQQLQEQINHICKSLLIDTSQAQISTLEIGVNIVTPYEVTPFIRQNIISYKGYSFNSYKPNAAGLSIGIYCTLSQYQLKIYDKGLQFNLPYRLLRFEKRFLKMQVLNKHGIKYLSDLLNYSKVVNLDSMLFTAWQNVLIYDIDTSCKTGSELLNNGQNPKFWERIKVRGKRQFVYQRDKFRKLVVKFGNNWQQLTKELIEKEWHELVKDCPNLPLGANAELSEFTIKIKGKIVQNNSYLPETPQPFIPVKQFRYCQSCGKDITNQRRGSKFCSAKVVGEAEAHQCRNNSSNPRNNLKRKIETIQDRGVLFDIVPYLITKNKRNSEQYAISHRGVNNSEITVNAPHFTKSAI